MLNATQTFLAAVFVMGLGLFVLMAAASFMGYGVSQLQRRERWIQWFLLVLMAIWYGVALSVSALGTLSFTLFAPFALLPIALGALLSFSSPIERLLRGIPTHWYVFLQAYRMGGGIFIFPYFTAGVLTRGFALNAGIGDVITGALAIPVGTMVMRNTRWSGLALVLWSIFGIVDLIVAPASALIFGAAGLTDYPINFIPLFLGPPFGILIHIITLRNYWIRRQAGLFAPRKTENQ